MPYYRECETLAGKLLPPFSLIEIVVSVMHAFVDPVVLRHGQVAVRQQPSVWQGWVGCSDLVSDYFGSFCCHHEAPLGTQLVSGGGWRRVLTAQLLTDVAVPWQAKSPERVYGRRQARGGHGGRHLKGVFMLLI